MNASVAELLQLQRKAERQRIVDYQPEFELDLDELDHLSRWSRAGASVIDVDRALSARKRGLRDLAALLSPAGLERLEAVAAAAHRSSVARFGKTMHMFAPLYLSNECVSECTYCGFQVLNRDIRRRTLSYDEVGAETRYLSHLGFRHVLLVAGEHPRHVSEDYISGCIKRTGAGMSSVSVEVQAWDTSAYRGFVESGCEGLVIYQECYDPRRYPDFHLKGNKRFWSWRLGAPERGADAGMLRIGLGTLIGLNPDWRWEVLALAAHARFLMRRSWRTEVTVALPRLEPAVGFERPPHVMGDDDFTLALCSLRLVLPDAGIVLSTRESPRLRDGLIPLGVTHMSAGSRTEPGGYSHPDEATEQFSIADHRSPAEISGALRRAGYDPVWKDSSAALRRGAPAHRL